jgi:DNA damage-binding protein 1
MSKYDQFFVNVMMVEELGLQVPDPDDDIVKEGVIMFLAFAGFGAMPLLGYALMPLIFPNLSEQSLFTIACVVTAVTLFVMGAIKSKFSTRGWFHSGLEMLLLGGVCAFLAYEIGHLVSQLVGVGEGPGV